MAPNHDGNEAMLRWNGCGSAETGPEWCGIVEIRLEWFEMGGIRMEFGGNGLEIWMGPVKIGQMRIEIVLNGLKSTKFRRNWVQIRTEPAKIG